MSLPHRLISHRTMLRAGRVGFLALLFSVLMGAGLMGCGHKADLVLPSDSDAEKATTQPSK